MTSDFPKQLFVAIDHDDPERPETKYYIAGDTAVEVFTRYDELNETNTRTKRVAIYQLVEVRQAELTVEMQAIS